MKCLAIFVGLFAVLVGIIVYITYLPFSPKLSEDSLVLPTLFNVMGLFAVVGEKLGIAPMHVTMQSLMTLADWTRLGHFEEVTGHDIEDTTISGVPVRIYRPRSVLPPDQARPALIYFHGGGMVICKARSNMYNKVCSVFSEGTQSVVISVEYRLAPEHKFPAAFQDSYSVVSTVIKESTKFGINKNKIAVGGDSAGGLLTAAVSLQLAKEKRAKDIAAQLLIFPWLQSIDMTCLSSYQHYSQGFFLTREQMAYYAANVVDTGKTDMAQEILSGNVSRYFMETPYWKLLEIPESSKCNIGPKTEKSLGNIPPQFVEAVVDPRLSPLLADTVEGSPPTFMATAEYDVLASEGSLFVRRLEKAGVPVVQKIYKTYHAFINNIAIPLTTTPMAIEAMQDMVNYLNSVFYET